MKYSHFKFVILVVLTIAVFSCKDDDSTDGDGTKEPTSNKPNILLIITDDMGLDATPGFDIGDIKPNMPNLQAMMDAGIRFENVWAYPVCSPTRASILTGKYGLRNGVLKVGEVLSTTETSIHKHLDDKSSGYESAVVGKWHLSTDVNHPNEMGIDHFAGFIGGGVSSYSNWTMVENGVSTNSDTYITSGLTDLAIDWIGAQSEPWFLWLAYNAPHTPFHLPPADLHSQGNLPDDQASVDANPLPYYLAMIEAVDTEMGRLFSAMSEEEKENTIIIFIGDNGTPSQVAQEYNSSRTKGSIYKGGVNVPMIISGKDVSRTNATEDALINATDLFATIADIAGTGTTEINDSKSFKALLTGSASNERDYIYTEVGRDNEGDYTIRNSTHKYMRFDNESEALYNLSANPMEKPNLLSENQAPLSDANAAIKEELVAKINEVRE